MNSENSIKKQKWTFFTIIKNMLAYRFLIVLSLITLAGVSLFEIYFPDFIRTIINTHISGNIKKIDGKSEVFYNIKNKHQMKMLEDKNVKIYDFDENIKSNYDLMTLINAISNEIEKDDSLVENKFVKMADLEKFDAEWKRELRKYDIDKTFVLIKYIFLILVFYIIIYFIHYFSVNYISQSMMYNLRSKIFNHMMNFKMSYFIKVPSGVLVTRVISDVEAINKFFSGVMVSWIKDIILFIGIGIMMCRINLRLSIVLFFIVPVLFMLIFYYQKKLKISYRNIRKQIARINGFLSENMSGMFIIKAFNREEQEDKKFNVINEDVFNAYKKQMFLRATFMPVTNITRYFSMASILVYGGYLILEGKMFFGDLIAFFTYAEMFFKPIREMVEKFDLLQSAQTGLERIFTILNDHENIESKNGDLDIEFKESIEFKNVNFEYIKDEKILKNINLKILKGEKIAFVGHTGAGKTTILNLINSFYGKNSGEILIDGKDIKEYNIDNLRRNLSYIPQDVFIFSESINYNITFSEKQNNYLDNNYLDNVSQKIGLEEFLKKQSHGFDTIMNERGNSLSYGEKQLIAFARALYFKPQIIIMDEATSNIDSDTEYVIQQATEKLLEGKTALIVAHRLSTIKNCDRIYVMKDGQIIETGKHEELLQKKGYYYKLYKIQYEKIA
ncbi:MAG: ABC transporter ATP-binding protein/permease [Candidatus Muirbacterium halophilum]|nr:ABC transporter ATP-binding protein/permease [Candidatus Muirbacterium halophilum]MCK9475101.1 ABC transporter ATP-binding protein/permease [Candidatus Muirbacterium halophilum]